MKLCMHPASITSRIVRLYAAEKGIPRVYFDRNVRVVSLSVAQLTKVSASSGVAGPISPPWVAGQ